MRWFYLISIFSIIDLIDLYAIWQFYEKKYSFFARRQATFSQETILSAFNQFD